MKPKPRTIKRQRAKGLGDRAKTGQKVRIESPQGAGKSLGDSRNVLGGISKATLVPLRIAVPEGVKGDLENIVTHLGLYPSISEMVRVVLLKERDRRLGELRRVRQKEEIERE